MKLHTSNRHRGFTLLEAIIVVVILFVLLAMLMPTSGPNRRGKAKRIVCFINLKQIGQASHIWAQDNGGHFPLQTFTTNNGEKVQLSDGIPPNEIALWNFKSLTNLLTSTRVFNCPADEHTSWDASYNAHLDNTNISYFVSLDADASLTNAVLDGDDNLAINDTPVNSGILSIPTNVPVIWTLERHIKAGNIGLADGSAQQVTTFGLQQALQQTGFATNHLAIP